MKNLIDLMFFTGTTKASQLYRNIQFDKDSTGKLICPKCGLSYQRKNSLVRHINYQCSAERKFSCTFCFKTYKFNFQLIKHHYKAHNIQ